MTFRCICNCPPRVDNYGWGWHVRGWGEGVLYFTALLQIYSTGLQIFFGFPPNTRWIHLFKFTWFIIQFEVLNGVGQVKVPPPPFTKKFMEGSSQPIPQRSPFKEGGGWGGWWGHRSRHLWGNKKILAFLNIFWNIPTSGEDSARWGKTEDKRLLPVRHHFNKEKYVPCFFFLCLLCFIADWQWPQNLGNSTTTACGCWPGRHLWSPPKQTRPSCSIPPFVTVPPEGPTMGLFFFWILRDSLQNPPYFTPLIYSI